MKKISFLTAVAFAVSVFALGLATPASAEGDCSFGHSKKTAQSTAQEVAQGQIQQTPKPSGS